MNWRKSFQTLTRLLAASLAFLGFPDLRFLVGALGGVLGGALLGVLASSELPSLESLGATLRAILVGSLGGSVVVSLRAALRAALEKKEKTGPRLILPPGAGLRDMLHVIYPPKTAERVFDQIIADMRLEWAEAMLHDQKWLAHWVRVRGLLTVLLTVLAHAVTALSSILKLVK